MSNLTNNTEKLQNLLTKINELPSAEGIDTSDATATASDIASGVTAYVNGKKITGNVPAIDNSLGFTTGTLSAVGSTFRASTTVNLDVLYRKNSEVWFNLDPATFGDAQPSDVASGKVFSSSAGLKVTGTASTNTNNAPVSLAITPSADTSTLSVTGLSKSDYGYLLECNAMMLFGEAYGSNDSYVISAFCKVPLTSTTHNWNTNPNIGVTYEESADQLYIAEKVIRSVTIGDNGSTISVTIKAYTENFEGGTQYRIIFFKI